MATFNVWVAHCETLEVDDDKFAELVKAREDENLDALAEFAVDLDQTFAAGIFGENQIVGIYDDDGNVYGIG